MSQKSPARAPPQSIEFPTSGASITRMPQSINLDIDDIDEEQRNDSRLTSSCLIAAVADDSFPTPSAPSEMAGLAWYQCDAGLLAAATALATTCKGKGLSSLAPSIASRITSEAALVEAFKSPSTAGIYYALSAKSYRVYQYGSGVAASGAANGGASDSAESTPTVSPSRAARGGTKDKITSAVAFDFVSGIMKGVVGGEAEELYGGE